MAENKIIPKLATINAPVKYANSKLNGCRCLVEAFIDKNVVKVIILNGNKAGRYWKICNSHLKIE
ncbi:MAG: hypothetical protein ACOC90_04660 [Bacteroidota bacterium]